LRCRCRRRRYGHRRCSGCPRRRGQPRLDAEV
jgi:hypothetical protein